MMFSHQILFCLRQVSFNRFQRKKIGFKKEKTFGLLIIVKIALLWIRFGILNFEREKSIFI